MVLANENMLAYCMQNLYSSSVEPFNTKGHLFKYKVSDFLSTDEKIYLSNINDGRTNANLQRIREKIVDFINSFKTVLKLNVEFNILDDYLDEIEHDKLRDDLMTERYVLLMEALNNTTNSLSYNQLFRKYETQTQQEKEIIWDIYEQNSKEKIDYSTESPKDFDHELEQIPTVDKLFLQRAGFEVKFLSNENTIEQLDLYLKLFEANDLGKLFWIFSEQENKFNEYLSSLSKKKSAKNSFYQVDLNEFKKFVGDDSRYRPLEYILILQKKKWLEISDTQLMLANNSLLPINVSINFESKLKNKIIKEIINEEYNDDCVYLIFRNEHLFKIWYKGRDLTLRGLNKKMLMLIERLEQSESRLATTEELKHIYKKSSLKTTVCNINKIIHKEESDNFITSEGRGEDLEYFLNVTEFSIKISSYHPLK